MVNGPQSSTSTDLSCRRINNLLKQRLGALLKRHGFHWNRGQWERDYEHGVCFISLYKSNFGCSFYIDLGLGLKPARGESLREDIGARLDRRVPDRYQCEEALWFDEDQEREITKVEQKVQTIEHLLERYGLPWLGALDSMDAIKRAKASGLLDGHVLISLDAQRLLKG